MQGIGSGRSYARPEDLLVYVVHDLKYNIFFRIGKLGEGEGYCCFLLAFFFLLEDPNLVDSLGKGRVII